VVAVAGAHVGDERIFGVVHPLIAVGGEYACLDAALGTVRLQVFFHAGEDAVQARLRHGENGVQDARRVSIQLGRVAL
jgi:hypothetical protein